MYYLFKFSDSVSLFDSKTQTTRTLEKSDADCLKRLFPEMFPESIILSAVAVSSIQPNKLSKLTAFEKNTGTKKMLDSAK